MSLTTLDLSPPVLRRIEEIRRKEGKSLGEVTSELLNEALTTRQRSPQTESTLTELVQKLEPLMPVDDKFADDLEDIRQEQATLPRNPWES